MATSGGNGNNEKLSISQYFSQSTSSATGASFFDQISLGNGPAMMTSVKESASSQDLFQAASDSLTTAAVSPTTATVTSTVITEASIRKPPLTASEISAPIQTKFGESDAKTPIKEQPVVCRIFSSQDSTDNTMASGKTFFDMLGSGGGQQNIRSPLSITSPTGAPALLGIDLMIPGLPTSSSVGSMLTSSDFTTTDGSILTPSSAATPTPTGENNSTFPTSSY